MKTFDRAVASHGVPVWRYLFRGIFPSWKTHPWLRAYHGQDALLLLGAVPGGQPPQPVERAAMAYLRKAWATFVLDPRAGLKHFGWPMYMPQGNGELLFFGPSYHPLFPMRSPLTFRHSFLSFALLNFSFSVVERQTHLLRVNGNVIHIRRQLFRSHEEH
jgi:hypothetical protein